MTDIDNLQAAVAKLDQIAWADGRRTEEGCYVADHREAQERAEDAIAAVRAEVDRLRAKLANLAMQRAGYRADWDAVQEVLSGALGSGADDGAGGGIAADVALLARQRDEARADNQRLRDGIEQVAKEFDGAAQMDREFGQSNRAYMAECRATQLRNLLAEAVAR